MQINEIKFIVIATFKLKEILFKKVGITFCKGAYQAWEKRKNLTLDPNVLNDVGDIKRRFLAEAVVVFRNAIFGCPMCVANLVTNKKIGNIL